MSSFSQPLILIMRPQEHFSIVGAELRRVASYGRDMNLMSRVKSEDIAVSEKPETDDSGKESDLHQLVALCERLLPDNLYSRYANRKVYRRMADFWATDDDKVKNYVKSMADQLLLKVVDLCRDLGIPMLFVYDSSQPLHIDDQLEMKTEDAAVPLMHFLRHDEGISYRLQLRLHDDEPPVKVMGHDRFVLLTYNPALFIIDSTVYRLQEGFNGKLLQPFIKKDSVEVPRRIEHTYLRRFIIRHIAKAEITAEGFDIEDIHLSPTPLLSTCRSIDGRWLLALSFRYDQTDYTPDNSRRGKVTLVEEGENYRFVRQLRDSQQEEHFIDILRQTGIDLSQQGIIRFESLKQMVDWLSIHAKRLRLQGFSVVQPSEQVYYIGPMSVEQTDTWQGDWLQTRVTVVLDEGRLRFPFNELRDAILHGEQEYLLATGERLLIPEEWLQRYGDLLLVGQQEGDHFKRHRCQLLDAPPADGESVNQERDDVDVEIPVALQATLRPYQQAGFVWLWRNFLAGMGCCLSDEMGLGKTLQTIALLLKYREMTKHARKPPQAGFLFSEEEMQGLSSATSKGIMTEYHTSLVLAPASVAHNWMAELKRFAPSLSVVSYTGDPLQRQKKRPALMRSDVVVTTYGMLLSDLDYLSKRHFGMVVMDESQVFKNHHSQVYQAVSSLVSDYRLALSGTPVENHLMELWSLMSILSPQLLADEKHFQQAFVLPIARHFEQERAQLLRRMVAPFFLKRTKEEVLSDLPPRQDEVVVCPMTDEQQSAYASELSKARNEWLDASIPENQRRIVMLAALQRLRQIANGQGKLDEVFQRLENLRESGHKVLIFSEYVGLLQTVGSRMNERGWEYDLLTGQTKQREAVINHFQQTPSCQFFLISLKAGGVGLNLTAADYVFLLDPWWNKAAEEQAIARAHRIGQQRPVFVYRFVSENTLEQQILQLQERKQDIIDSVMPFFSEEFRS